MVLPALLAAFWIVQAADKLPVAPHDRVVELEITEDDESAIEAHGPTVLAEYESLFDGTLHVWTTSELDLFVRVDDASNARPLASDNDSGGGTTPYLELDVGDGDLLMVLVAGDPGATGPLTLHLIATPETEAGRMAEAAAQNALRESRRLMSEGRQADARRLLAAALPKTLDSAGSDHPNLLAARARLAASAVELGDFPGAHALHESVVAARERTLPDDHPDLLRARLDLAISLSGMGDLPGARALEESVLASRERTLPEGHPDLLLVRGNLASTMSQMGDIAEARALEESILAAYERALPEDHPEVLRARGNLAVSLDEAGDVAEAHALRESILAAYERTLPKDHTDLLRSRGNLANSKSKMGDLAGARALGESVLAGYERTLPEDHPDLLRTRGNLAVVMSKMGDLAGARALKESVLAAYERTLPEDHPALLGARTNVANSMANMGDLDGARALQESILAAYERTLPEDHPQLLLARGNLANLMSKTGELGGARALRESVLAGYERALPEDHHDVLRARSHLATSLLRSGDFAGARALDEAVLAAQERTLPEDHPDLLGARGKLAHSMAMMGDFAGARALEESILAGYERTLPEDHPELLRARANLATSMAQTGDLAAARLLLPKLVAGMMRRSLSAFALAPRQALQTIASESNRLSKVLVLSDSTDAEVVQSIFDLTETMRLVAAEAARSLARFETDSELAPILEKAAELRRALNDLVAGAASEALGTEGLASRLTELSLQRDRLERDASRRLAQRGVITRPVEADRLSEALGPGDVAIGYRRVALGVGSGEYGPGEAGADHLMAHVLNADGALNRLDLGPASELEELAGAWRAALGAPIGGHAARDGAGAPPEPATLIADGSRGIAMGAGIGESLTEAAELNAGRILRHRILDPVLAVVEPHVERIFVCADDMLFLLPLDALPIDAEGEGPIRVGDRLQIVSGVSFARLLAPLPMNAGEPSLLSLGGVDYEAPAAAPEGRSSVSAPIELGTTSRSDDPANGPVSRSAIEGGFPDLVQTRHEAEGIATLFEKTFETAPALLTRQKTTKTALFDSAPGKRYLHLATHGWFAPKSVRSTQDDLPTGDAFSRVGIEERIAGLAPMTLCGLALAGANKGRDSLGRVPGILTAEELCSLDLSQCELAVLSACETNVGIRRAGQGIQSLQSALYAAGARTSITSLWKVDDAATRSLMEAFYRNLWVEGMGKADALWQAKQSLRDEGGPPAHWAGWVLTGDPD